MTPPFHFSSVRRKLYSLSCLVIASNDVHALGDKPNIDYLSLAQEFEVEEITQLLIETAAAIRLADDRMRKETGYNTSSLGINVGRIEVEGESITIPISLREACNKILHAESHIPNYVDSDDDSLRYLSNSWSVCGMRSGIKWTATIDLVAYCFTAAELVLPIERLSE